MLNVGILGVGNAGNQVVAHAFTQKKSISVFALNCSESDLKTIPDGIPKALVGDGKGAGKNPPLPPTAKRRATARTAARCRR